jgi:hypothetical protein
LKHIEESTILGRIKMMFSVRPRIIDLVSWFFWNASRILVRALRLVQFWFLGSLLNPEFLTL